MLIESGTCDYCLGKNRYSKSYPDYSRVATSGAVTQVLISVISEYQNRIVVHGTFYKMSILLSVASGSIFAQKELFFE